MYKLINNTGLNGERKHREYTCMPEISPDTCMPERSPLRSQRRVKSTNPHLAWWDSRALLWAGNGLMMMMMMMMTMITMMMKEIDEISGATFAETDGGIK
ncbi:jg4923 [Pararge aegeria aegeria]|uniref:Jg4923 protein n=1 Tax=Pararge aegeria aegeria TaxID=348720 RepID=A0A8S4SEF3_9NEOP|nr:jg4923 [Pararge aegeria aegeria]